MVKKAIIPAAGFGTRCLPITKTVPKELFPIGVKPAIHYVVEEAVAAGIEEILIIVSRSKTMISDYFDRSLEIETFLRQQKKSHLLEKIKMPDIRIQYIHQPYASGLGDAIRLGKSFVGNEPFAVLLPDEVILGKEQSGLGELLSLYNQSKSCVLGLKKVDDEQLSSYGVVEVEKQHKETVEVKSIVEKPTGDAPSNSAIIGRYVFNPTIFTALEQTKVGLGGEIQLTDAMNQLLKTEAFFGIHVQGERFDTSKLDEYIEANKYVQQAENNRLKRNGVEKQ